jgi:hypothetical protein
MAALEQITNLKQQGKTDQEIISTLQSQGISPKEITDGLAQSQVKSAVAGQNVPIPPGMQQGSIMDNPQKQGEQNLPPPKPGEQDLQSPTLQNPQEPRPPQGQQPYIPPQQESYMPPQPTQGMQEPQQEFYQPEEGAYEEGYETDTMIDVAEQVFAEKMSEISKHLTGLKELKTLTESRVKNIEERLLKLESIMDKLQIEILKKVGSYGDNLQSIKNEMSMMQNSFGKVINPLVDKNSNTSSVKKPIIKK